MKLNMGLLFAVAALFLFQNSHAQRDTLQREFYKIKLDSLVKSNSINNEYGIERTVILKYPVGEVDENIEGTVIIEFDLDSNCAWVNFRIVKSLVYAYDEAVLRAYRSMKTIYREGPQKCKPMFNLRQSIRFKRPED
jgi:TonB family protein